MVVRHVFKTVSKFLLTNVAFNHYNLLLPISQCIVLLISKILIHCFYEQALFWVRVKVSEALTGEYHHLEQSHCNDEVLMKSELH